MEEIILDEYIEKPLLRYILEAPEKILQIPKEIYQKIYDFLVQEERFEDLIKLKAVENKVINKTLDEVIEEAKKTNL